MSIDKTSAPPEDGVVENPEAAAGAATAVDPRLLVREQGFAGYVADWSFGPDQLLFRARLAGNVMAPNTAMAFVLVGIAILVYDLRVSDGVHPAQSFLLAAAAIAHFPRVF